MATYPKIDAQDIGFVEKKEEVKVGHELEERDRSLLLKKCGEDVKILHKNNMRNSDSENTGTFTIRLQSIACTPSKQTLS